MISKLQESQSHLHPKTELSLILSIANRLLNEKKFDEAIEVYSEAIDLDPQCEAAYFNRGLARFSHALESFYRRSTKFSYQNFKESLNKAYIDYSHVINLNPNNVDAYKGRGECCWHLNAYLDCYKDYKQAGLPVSSIMIPSLNGLTLSDMPSYYEYLEAPHSFC